MRTSWHTWAATVPESAPSAFTPPTAGLTRIGLAVETPASSFLVVHPNGHYVYAVNERGQNDDTVSAFAIDPKTAKLAPLNTVHSRGSSPCHLALDKTGRFLAVANYGSGSTAVLPVLPDGRLGEACGFNQHQGSSVNRERQSGPHAHCVVFSPDNRFLLSADLGADKIFVYRFDAANGAIAPNDPPSFTVRAGSGPRHIEFHPNGRIAYVITEMGSTIEALQYNAAAGTLDAGETVSTLPEKFNAPTIAAELAINAAGTVLYASNRAQSQSGLVLFHLDADGSALAMMEHVSSLGKTPRFFTFDPSGQFLLVANQDSDNLVVFKVHPATGELRPEGPIVTTPKPSCIAFVR